ncbi:MAG: amino acid adenylation domain-containing protein [Peptococcaceae bacterium]|nr:amino acid adenylation domain-containing protein [Peptococcaceae bacterium]
MIKLDPEALNTLTIAPLVEQQVKNHPHKTAIICRDQEISYGALNRAANRVAHKLRAIGVGPDDIVALASQRDPALIVGILGALKAGGAYLPINPAAPAAQVRDMLADSNAKAALVAGVTLKEAMAQAPASAIPIIDLFDAEYRCETATHHSAPNSADYNTGEPATDNPSPTGKPSDIAYCLYTSGTTGKLKGVLVEQRNIINFALYNEVFLAALQAVSEPRVISTTTPCFDIFATESLLPLLHGWCILLADEEEQRDSIRLAPLVENHQGTFLNTTPSKMRMLMTSPDRCGYLSGLSAICLSGEPFPPEMYTQIRRHTQAHIINAYGPTETTVFMTMTELHSDDIHIGKAIPNTQVVILDGMERCGIGVPGELCVSGACVARGYLNNPDLTAALFLPNPFGEGRLYRTGDLARWRPDGNLECLGRIDNQVKIRGYRVELGEIESALRRQDDVADAAVILKEDETGESVLHGYVVATGAASLPIDALRAALRQDLPEYMVPQRLMQIERIPLTLNGKTNKKALPKIVLGSTAEFTAPSSLDEKMIALIFQELLGVSSVSIFDNFFALGGHSLRVTNGIAMLEEVTGVRLPLRDWFETPTVQGIAAALKAARAASREGPGAPSSIPPAPSQPWYPLSPAQQRLYLACQTADRGTAYNMPLAIELSGEIVTTRAQDAVRALLARHAALRTSFHIHDTASPDSDELLLRQRIEPPEDVVNPFIIETMTDTDTAETLLSSFVQPFDLSCAPLLRIKAVVGPNRTILLIDMHHIISDQATAVILLDEFTKLYAGEPLPPTETQYIDWSEWAQKRDLSAQQSFWLNMFRDEPPATHYATDFSRPSRQRFEGAVATLRLDAPLRRQVETFAGERDGTPFMVLLTALIALLGKHGRQEDVTVGYPVSNRLHSDCARTAGLFVNMLALRGRPEGSKPFATLFDEIARSCTQALENQEYPYERLVEELRTRQDMSRNPLFDVTITLDHEPPDMYAEYCGLPCVHIAKGPPEAKFELTFNIVETDDAYAIELIYRTALFAPESAERMLRHYRTLLETAISTPARTLGDLPLMDASEYDQVRLFSNTPAGDTSRTPPTPSTQTFVSLFATHVAAHPNHTALLLGDQQITYEELDRITDIVARWLLSVGVQREDIVAVYSGRGFGYPIGALGVMKAGAAFLPLDASAPAARSQFILADSGATALLLADASLPFATTLPTYAIDPQAMNDSLSPLSISPQAEGYQPRPLSIVPCPLSIVPCPLSIVPCPLSIVPCPLPHTLAYSIYTSGTTGQPKGALLEHRGLANLSSYFISELGINPADTVLQFASCAFDASVWEMTMALTCGATLRLLPTDASLDPTLLRENLRHCTVALLPPPLIPAVKPRGLRLLLSGGSAATPETVRLAASANGSYINAYGPTETTICATAWAYLQGDKIPANVPIGKPLPGVELYIAAIDNRAMDNEKQATISLCAIGIPGELCVGGAGVGRGYLNRPELTAEKFVRNPFIPSEGDQPSEGNHPSKRALSDTCPLLYRTGDLARWLPDGNIEYLGRLDDQIKIRGFRVELGEVEAALERLPNVNEAAVVTESGRHTDDEKELIAYIAAPDLDPVILRAALARSLPDYMIPARYIRLDALPKTVSGKIDKPALPAPTDRPNIGATPAPPQDREEKLVSRVFEEILSIENIGVNDSFFALGGDSIKAIRIVSRIREAGYNVSVHDIMEQRTAAAIATTLRLTSGDIGDQSAIAGVLPLTPIQQAFFTQQHTHPHHFNQALAIRCDNPLEEHPLRAALAAVFEHHDMLRAVYPGGTQTILPVDAAPITLDIVDLRGQSVSVSDLQSRNTALQSSFDLEKGPLLRVALNQTEDGDHLLLIAHHLIIDSISWYILAEDLFSAYSQVQAGHTPLLPAKTASFRDWALSLQSYAAGGALTAEQPYWIEEMANIERYDLTPAQTDILRQPDSTTGTPSADSPGPTPKQRISHIRINSDIVYSLLFEAGKAYDTEINDLLLCAFALAVRRRTGRQKICVELESHGRLPLSHLLNLDRTIGWFTCSYPVTLPSADTVEASILMTKQALRAVPNQGIGYSLLLARGDFGSVPRPRFGFNYLGDEDNGAASVFGPGMSWSTIPLGEMIAAENSLCNEISVSGGIRRGELTFTVAYDAAIWSEAAMADFCDAYETALSDIVLHCRNHHGDNRFDLDQSDAEVLDALLGQLTVDS